MDSDPVLFTGGPIRTLGQHDGGEDDLPPALLVENGHVRAVGSEAQMRAYSERTPRRIDLEGRALLPGFVDAHAHTLLLGARLDRVDLSAAGSIPEIVEVLSRRSRTQPDGPVWGYGYDQSRLREQRHPHAAELDQVSQTRPVLIQHASGHGYAINHTMLYQAGITAATPVPEGGRIDRDEDGAPTGVVFDAACDLVTGSTGVKVGNHGPNIHLTSSGEEANRLFRLGQQEFLRAGVTTVCDAQVSELELASYLRVRDEGQLNMRAHLMVLSSNLEHLRGLGLVSTLGDERLQFYGVKLYADGSVIARTAYLGGESCCETPTPEGYLYHTREDLAELIQTAHTLGLRVGVHTQGEMPIGVVIDAIANAQAQVNRPGLHHRIEHCGFPSDEQIATMRQLGVVPVPQPMQTYLFGDSLLAELGEDGGRFYPLGSFCRAGLPVVISSDAPVTRPHPLAAVWAAVTRQTRAGAVAGGTHQQVSTRTAMQGVTSTPATLLGRDDIGTLQPGARADLVLLDGDPMTAASDALPQMKVTETWVDGSPVWTEHAEASQTATQAVV